MESYQERQKRQRSELDTKLAVEKDKAWEKLAAKLIERGHTIEFHEPEDGLGLRARSRYIEKIDGRRCMIITITEEREGGYVGAIPNGKLRITVGDWGNKRRFFQSKARDGDFDYDAIAIEVEARIEKAKANSEKKRDEQKTEHDAEALRAVLVRQFSPPSRKERVRTERRGSMFRKRSQLDSSRRRRDSPSSSRSLLTKPRFAKSSPRARRWGSSNDGRF